MYKYFLHSKSSYNSLYTLNLLFLHIPECKLLKTKFLNTLFILDTASLEPSDIIIINIYIYNYNLLPAEFIQQNL